MINAWARSEHPDQVHRGHALLHEMMDRYRGGDVALRPDAVVLAVLLKICARATTAVAAATPHQETQVGHRQKVLLLTMEIVELLEGGEFGSPSDVTYSTALLAINRMAESTEQREELLGSVFLLCAGRGLVSNTVMAEMNRGGSQQLFLRLTDGTNQVPAQWTAKVPLRHRPMLTQ